MSCRRHLLVLPSVVCATRVAADIAEELGAVTITHQHGCSQVGDDGVQHARGLRAGRRQPERRRGDRRRPRLRDDPGPALADAIARARPAGRARRHPGPRRLARSVARGVELGRALLAAIADAPARRRRQRSVIGIEASHASPLAAAFAERRWPAGAGVVLRRRRRRLPECRGVPALPSTARARGDVSRLPGAARSSTSRWPPPAPR